MIIIYIYICLFKKLCHFKPICPYTLFFKKNVVDFIKAINGSQLGPIWAFKICLLKPLMSSC